MADLTHLIAEAVADFANSASMNDLEIAKAKYLGKSGSLTDALKGLGKLSAEERPAAGAAINEVKQAVEAALTARREAILNAGQAQQLAQESIDVTLPARAQSKGGLHPVTLTLKRVEALFHSIGFEVATGPEIETDFYNFTALNIPEDHPARAMHDTFYIDEANVLRTHTSPVQVRYMENALRRNGAGTWFPAFPPVRRMKPWDWGWRPSGETSCWQEPPPMPGAGTPLRSR